MQAVYGGVLDGLHSSGRPANDRPVHAPGGPEPEVQPPVVLACESDTAVYDLELTPRAALECYLRADRAAVRARAHQLEGDPVVVRHDGVPVDQYRLVLVRKPERPAAALRARDRRARGPGGHSLAFRNCADHRAPRRRPLACHHRAWSLVPFQLDGLGGHSWNGTRRALWARLGGLDPRYPVSFLITLILVLGQARYGILGGYDRLATALGVCVATELALSRWLRGRFANVQSAYITGISLALLIKPRDDLLCQFALAPFLAIASKYVLQYRGRHLWNPSNFAISLLVLLAPASVAILSHQWGNDLATNAVIWCFGLLIASRVRMLHVTLTYVACFVALALVRSSIVGGPLLAEIAPLTGPMYQLFIFFMITDPKTTVSTVRGRMIVAAAVAVAEAAIRLAGDFHVPALAALYPAPPILALAIVGPVANVIDLYRAGRSSPL